MTNMLKRMVGTLVGASLLLLPTLSFANDLTLKLEPGVAVPVTDPQSDRFDTGFAASGKILYGLTPHLDIGPSVSALVLTSDMPGVTNGTTWGFGGSLRLKRPHDSSNKGTGLTAVSPWVDGDLQYVRTGDLNRAGVAMAVGAAVPTSDSRNLWVGPFVRYQDVLQAQRNGFESSDAHVFIVGLSLEVGPKAKKVQTVRVVDTEESDRDKDGTPDSTDRCPDVPGPKENYGCPPDPKPTTIVAEHRTVRLAERIQFLWDSAVIQQTEIPVLTDLTNVLLTLDDRTSFKVKIEGHASSEGTVEHNDVLAQQRADAVLDYLVAHGVSKESLTATGFGSSMARASNATAAGRSENRRVEFVISIVIVKNGEE